MKIRILPNENRLVISLADGDVTETKVITKGLPDSGGIKSATLELDAQGNLLSVDLAVPNFPALWAALTE